MKNKPEKAFANAKSNVNQNARRKIELDLLNPWYFAANEEKIGQVDTMKEKKKAPRWGGGDLEWKEQFDRWRRWNQALTSVKKIGLWRQCDRALASVKKHRSRTGLLAKKKSTVQRKRKIILATRRKNPLLVNTESGTRKRRQQNTVNTSTREKKTLNRTVVFASASVNKKKLGQVVIANEIKEYGTREKIGPLLSRAKKSELKKKRYRDCRSRPETGTSLRSASEKHEREEKMD